MEENRENTREYAKCDGLTEKTETWNRIHFQTIDSTNEEAKRRFHNGERETVLISADCQTAGKGRNGRSFYSPMDTGIYFSFIYCDEGRHGLTDMIFVTTAAAVFVCDALIRTTRVNAGIKWVNDVYVEEKKVCGILAEAVFDGDTTGIVVGIGINLSTREFPKEIREIASGVGDFSEEELWEIKSSILQYVGDGLNEFFRNCEDKEYRKEILEAYKKLSVVIGKSVSFYEKGDVLYTGVARDIEEDGSLLVELDSGETRRLDSGEIHLRVQTEAKPT